MREARPGFWIPDEPPGSDIEAWMFAGTDGSVPTYAMDRIEACVAACRARGRLRVAVDGGAFVGSWSIHLAKHFAQVHAFEPIAANYACLVKNTVHIDNVLRHKRALADKIGGMVRASDGTTVPHGHKVRFVEPNELCEFDSMTLDYYPAHQLDLVKLDLEGFEYRALIGGIDVIHDQKPVVMIEEKHDPERRATKLLESWGMCCTWQKKHDYLFTWPKD